MKRVAYLTCAKRPEITPDDALALPHLAKLGIEAQARIWDDPAADWSAFDAVVIRSPWDYFEKPEALERWIDDRERDGTRVLNPLSVIRWNLNKRYLMELYEKGIAIPKSVWLKRGSRVAIDDWLEAKGIREAVVKPAFNAGGVDTFRVPASEVQACLDRMLPSRDMLVQEFEPQIERMGEVSLLFFNGEYSHANVKTPKQGEFRIQESHGGKFTPFRPEPMWIEAAQRVLGLAPANPLLYARVDMVLGSAGKPLLMELEVFEPSLYLLMDPEAAPARFARALAAQLR